MSEPVSPEEEMGLLERAQAAGIDILFSVREAAALIPMRESYLRLLLSKHSDLFSKPQYRRSRVGRRYRMLTGADVQQLRALITVHRKEQK